MKNQRERETDKLKRTKFKESRKGNLFEGGGEKKKGTRMRRMRPEKSERKKSKKTRREEGN